MVTERLLRTEPDRPIRHESAPIMLPRFRSLCKIADVCQKKIRRNHSVPS